ncbi:putative calcium-transporting ATPase 13, plasma membrane-type [Vigna angularis]|uniref:putative calcium-transporting ATPase 13, plasma membrane-type n=1 Tax=Phaseolus angularis TaxID=3914 RepID=UPI000809F10C|nr:putative calcium-transporting ATPase 13, plasma membrane-type [Vigna angularis]
MPPLGRVEPLITTVMWRNLISQALYQVMVQLGLEFRGRSIFDVIEKLVKVEFLKKITNTKRLTWEQWGVCISIRALSWPIGVLVQCIPVVRKK